MSAVVFDTNVLLVANGLAPQMSGLCQTACLNRLNRAKSEEAVVVDRRFLILGEYRHKLNPNRRPPGPGDAFVRHVLQNMKAPARVSLIDLTPVNPEKTDFKEFPPDDGLRKAFDPADRKFVAAACAHPEKPPIVQSADSKWLAWEASLSAHGIRLEVLCREELQAIRDRKTKP